MHRKEENLTENHSHGVRNPYKTINQWRKLKFVHGIAFCRKTKQFLRLFRLPRNKFLSEIANPSKYTAYCPALARPQQQNVAKIPVSVHSVLQVDSTQRTASWQYTVYCKLTVHNVLLILFISANHLRPLTRKCNCSAQDKTVKQ
jgi:hypothetical protein